MALVDLGFTRCPLCDQTIEAGDDTVASDSCSAFGKVDLHRYYDAALHRHCFLRWEHREEYVRQFNQSNRDLVFDQKRCHMDATGTIHLVPK